MWLAAHGFQATSRRGFLRGRPDMRLNGRIKAALHLAEMQSHLLDGGYRLACFITLSIKILIWSVGNASATYLPPRKETAKLAPRNRRLLRGAMLSGGKCPY